MYKITPVYDFKGSGGGGVSAVPNAPSNQFITLRVVEGVEVVLYTMTPVTSSNGSRRFLTKQDLRSKL